MAPPAPHPLVADLIRHLSAEGETALDKIRPQVLALDLPDEACRVVSELLLLAFYYDEEVGRPAAADSVIDLAKAVVARLGPHAAPLAGERLERAQRFLCKQREAADAGDRTRGLDNPTAGVRLRWPEQKG